VTRFTARAAFREARLVALLVPLGCAMSLGTSGWTQEPTPTDQTMPPESGLIEPAATDQEAGAPPERPGKYHIGPFYVTPSLRIGMIGFDSNVYYTPSEQRADFSASGGPALDIVLPIYGPLRWKASGGLSYLYFLRNDSQRALQGTAATGLEWKRRRTQISLTESWGRIRQRPNPEIDSRVLSTVEGTQADILRHLFGRTKLHLFGSRSRTTVDPGETYLGTDLSKALSRDTYRFGGGLRYELTIKTSFLIDADRQQERYRDSKLRDSDTDTLVAGFETDPSALISGRAVAGVQQARTLGTPRLEERAAVVRVDATLNLSVKTHVGFVYQRELSPSAFAVSADRPWMLMESQGLKLSKDLIGSLNLEVFGWRRHLLNSGQASVQLPDGSQVVTRRDDVFYEGGGDLGYRFRSRLRIGVAVSYVQRRSNLSYFGIQGLTGGLTVRYEPKQPSFP
jgi:hypothetical protein